MKYRIGIDVGGTFTDFLLTDEKRGSEVYKVLSTPGDPSEGLLNGLREMASSRDVSLEEFASNISIIVHGTTVTTNAVLTRKGAETGLVTTDGVRDALEMRRGIREKQYDNRYTNVKPLVPRYLRRPVRERLDYKGDVVEELDEEDVLDAIELFKKQKIEAVAVCYMNSFANPEHEQRTTELIHKHLPHAYITTSSTFLPSIRFYDRLSTTVLNSYVGPALKSYLENLIRKLKEAGFCGILLIMQSSGGVVTPEFAMENAAATLLSGPAAGPVAGIEYSSIQGYSDCITIDMGGTSFDAALIKNKIPLVTTEGEIDRLRIALPMLGIVTIGSGGGSIGWVDEGGLLRMGPESAGAKPGPACYGMGGELPTCTDADLLLGYLDEKYFAGGKIPLHRKKAETAIEKHVARKLNMSVVEAAAGMYRVINVNMAAGVREVSVRRGEDPREFPLVVAGGAGPVHACMIAHELEIPVLIIPRESSIFCAAGMLMSDLKHDQVRTYSTLLHEIDKNKFNRLFTDMQSEIHSLLIDEGIPESSMDFNYSLDMRYLKQYHELNVKITPDEINKGDVESIASKFHPEHNRLYGYSLEEERTPIEIINLRVAGIGRTEKPRFLEEDSRAEDPSSAMKGERRVWIPFKQDYEILPVYDGSKLGHGNKLEGPALIEEANTTLFITPEYDVACDPYGSFTLYLKSAGAKPPSWLRRAAS